MQTQQYPTFHKGITDWVLDPPVGYARKLDNLVLDTQGKPMQRWGSAAYITAYPTVPDTVAVLNLTRVDITPVNYVVLAFTDSHAYVTDAAAWTPVTNANGGVFFSGAGPVCGFYVNRWEKAYYQVTIDQDVTSLFAADNYYAYAVYPRAIWADNFGAWKSRVAGLPAFRADAISTWTTVPSAPAGVVVNGGSSFSYIYYFVWVYKSIGVDGTSYLTISTPAFTSVQTSSAMGTAGTQVTWTLPVMASNPRVDVTALYKRIYRTANGGTSAFLLAEVSNATTSYVDTAVDATVLTAAAFYQNDGTVSYDMPRPCRYSTIVNGTGYYGSGCGDLQDGPDRTNSLWQCSPGSVDASPQSFSLDFEEPMMALDNIDYFPVVFLESKVYRVEGAFDQYGNGAMVKRLVTGSTGAVASRSVAKAGRMLYFAGKDGIYATDGFSATKISKHLDATYKALTSDWFRATMVIAKFDPNYNRVFFMFNDNGSSDGWFRTVWVLDLNLSTPEEGVFTTWSGGPYQNWTASAFEWLPARKLLRGDNHGYVFVHSEGVLSESYPFGNGHSANPQTYPVVSTLQTPAWSAGDSAKTKWSSKLYLSMKHLADGTTGIHLLTQHERDINGAWYAGSVLWKSGMSGTQQQIYRAKRMLQRGATRYNYISLQVGHAFTNLYRSDDYATVNVSGTTATLTSGTWPFAALVAIGHYKVYFSSDSYTVGYIVTGVSGAAVTLGASPGTLTGVKWVVKGYGSSEYFYWDNIELVAEQFQESNVLGHTYAEDLSNA